MPDIPDAIVERAMRAITRWAFQVEGGKIPPDSEIERYVTEAPADEIAELREGARTILEQTFGGGEWSADYGWQAKDGSMSAHGYDEPLTVSNVQSEATVRDIWHGSIRPMEADHA